MTRESAIGYRLSAIGQRIQVFTPEMALLSPVLRGEGLMYLSPVLRGEG